MPETYRVEMQGMSKSFGGVNALNDVTIRVRPGEIHALAGENGAGKSTLMKILSGAYQKDSGEITIDGVPVDIPNPSVGRKLGIGIIYQEFALAPDLTVAENIYLSHLSLNKKGLINWTQLYKDAGQLLQQLGFDINPKILVRELSVAYQQIVEITKALSEEIKILILDEPTAVLSPQEAEKLFAVLFQLKQQGVSIIYISHRLEEIFKIADTLTVIKDGEVVDTCSPNDITLDDVIRMMIGRELTDLFPKRSSKIGGEIFQVDGLSISGLLEDISFSVKAGEVLGFAGLVGSGRTEVMRAIFGADRRTHGEITLKGTRLQIKNPHDAVKYRIGMVPENRKEQGVILDSTVKINMTMPILPKVRAVLGIIKQKTENTLCQSLVDTLNIKTPGINALVSELSGGNQQKVALAKWFRADCQVIILDEPTRGVDVGAKTEIYHLINELAAEGIAVIVVSSEMMEIIGICDRVMVMSGGRITRCLHKDELTEENIMKAALPLNRERAREGSHGNT